jgi:hypothetical protein
MTAENSRREREERKWRNFGIQTSHTRRSYGSMLSEEGIAVEGDSVSLSRCLHLVNTGIGFSGSPAKSHVSNTALI